MRQYFAGVLVDPPIANLTAVTATSETGLWNVANYSPINANDMTPGKIYRLSAGGILSTAASGTLIITPRYGTTTGGVTLGASVTQTVPINLSNVPWYLQFDLVCRTIGAPGSNSTVIGSGFFVSAGTAATAGSAFALSFGGTSGTVDASVASGIFIGWTLSVAGSNTPQYVHISSLS